MGLKEYNGIFNKNLEIKVEKLDFNYRVLEKLKNDNLIDNFNEEEGHYYIVKNHILILRENNMKKIKKYQFVIKMYLLSRR